MIKNEPDFTDILAQIQEDEDNCDCTLDRQEVPTDETINDYVLKKGSELLESNIDTINRIKNRIATAHDPDELMVLSNLIKSANSVLTTLTSISLQNKKDKASREISASKALNNPKTVNNTLLVGTREEVIKQILDMKNADVIDVESDTQEEESNAK